MRKGFIVIASFLIISKVSLSQITWDGGGADGLWATATNWSGDVIPGVSDDVLLDNSIVAGTYTVTLPNGTTSVSVNSLTITPNGVNNIILLLPNTNTSSTGFIATGVGDGVVLNSGAIFQNSSGATASSTPVSVTSTNFFRINNGGKYIHNTQRKHTDFLAERLSTAAGTELGIFEFDVPTTSTYTLSMSDRTYGTIILSGVSGDPTYIASGSFPCNINGNFFINNNANFKTSFSADLIVHGNFYQQSNSSFDLQTSNFNNIFKIAGDFTAVSGISESGSGLPIIEFNGTANQNLSIQNQLSNSITLRINNPIGVTVSNSFTLPYQLDLTLGNLKTAQPSKLLIMAAGSFWTNASANSFVEGPMKKIGNTDFIFPIGVGSIYAPLGIFSSTGSISDQYTAEYKRSNPQNVHGTVYASGLHHISYVEYWNLVQNVGTGSVQVQLDVHFTSFCRVIANTYVSRWNGSQWTNEATISTLTGTIGGYELGNVKTSTAIPFDGDFTLATDLDNIQNPLPILLVDFNAIKIDDRTAAVEWSLAVCCSKDAVFEIQKSTDSRNYVLLARVGGSETNRFYNYNDTHLEKGITYYRLKMTDVDGKVSYSKVIAVINDSKGIIITSIAPNPVADDAVLNISSAKQGNIHLAIYNMAGVAVKQWTASVQEGNNAIHFNTGKLMGGIYHLVAISDNSRSVLRFVKQ